MKKIACLAFACATLGAAVFACSSSNSSAPATDDGGSASSVGPTDSGSDGGCTGEPSPCATGASATCTGGQWVCPPEGTDCSCAAIQSFACGAGGLSCPITSYCLLDALPDGGPASPGNACNAIQDAGSGTASCESILGSFDGDAGGCTCSQGVGVTISCPVFPCGQGSCAPNEYCQLFVLPDGGPSSPSSQCSPLPTCDGGAPTCACLLAARGDDAGACSCTVDGYGRPVLDCPAL